MACVAQQQAEKTVFSPCQLQRPAVLKGAAAQELYGDAAAAQGRRSLRFLYPGPAQQGPDTGAQLAQPERLCDIIVPAAVQTADDADFLVGGGQKDDGNPAALPAHSFAEVEAGSVRQGDVQEQQVVAADFGKKPGGLPKRPDSLRLKAVFL